MKNKRIVSIIIISIISLCLIGGGIYCIFKQRIDNEKEELITVSPYVDTLNNINKYQEKYFEIIKRNNALLMLKNNEEAMKDLRELKSLFQEVKNKIKQDSEYLKEYEKIKENYKTNPGKTTFEMNNFAKENYDAVDKLLNNVYNSVKSKIPKDDFEQLKASQINWLKEVEDYNNIFEAQQFGTIGTLIKLDYEINMRCFRTLLLMLYFKD